ncbi:MAG: DUF4783 domain-containing protein [Ignavibacteriaceae bacterium]|nr:DUF4783 domain-containing protein [Ignavibacteria bacterium]MBT8392455.1 DUF4783 domain-containing protein [Ignavibacteria bacterium]NNL19914.1 DUF4783 domain-containing protein [Ignavibacteriaceae bacterium]
MFTISIKSAIILYFVLFIPFALSQDINFNNNLNSTNSVRVEIIALNQIEEGIKKSEIKKLTDYFAAQPYISLLSGVNGYYSSNQAYYIIEEFFKNFRVVSFNFENKKFEENVVYGTGEYYYERKGKRESALLYITLNKTGNKWVISQISIN